MPQRRTASNVSATERARARSTGRASFGSAVLAFVAAGVLMACRAEPAPEGSANASADPEQQCDESAARDVVERMGEQLRQVSLLADDSTVRRQVRDSYAPLVTPALLEVWSSGRAGPPGRDVSSPWPERIEIRSVEAAGAGECIVAGEVVYVTSADAPGEAAVREPVTLRVRGNGAWRISAYEAGASGGDSVPPTPTDSVPPVSTDAANAVDLLRDYYAAIGEHEFRRAYELWGGEGTASGQTFEEFAAGFDQTASVQLEAGTPGRVEGAAGSRYVEVPVIIRAVTVAGDSQRFEGTYTLRRSVVEGASADQRQWRIYSADITQRH